jgi:YggT family protein
LILILDILQIILTIIWWVIIVQAILSWLIAFNVINTHNEYVGAIWRALRTMTDPIYRPIRRVLPDFGGLDLSPMVVLIVLLIIQQAVMPALYRLAIGAPL